MKTSIFTLLLLAATSSTTYLHAQSQEKLLLSGWHFHQGTAAGAEASDYDDKGWESVSIPHDWAIQGPFDKKVDMQVVAIEQNHERIATEKTGRTGALPWIGEGWYRTTFPTLKDYTHYSLVFDGAMAEPEVYVNGKLAGVWKYGYTTFELEITPLLNQAGEENTLAVHLTNPELSSRWYPGGGLYRPVRLCMSQDLSIQNFGNYVRTSSATGLSTDGSQASEARLTVKTDILCRKEKVETGKLRVIYTLLDSEGKPVAQTTSHVNDAWQANGILRLANARLWSPEHPVLYTLKTSLVEGNRTWDEKITKTGIRTLSYTEENGFQLNGVKRRIKGVCLHHDLGPIGTAFYKAAFIRQVKLLKDIGCDAIRTSHNIPAPWQMDICDSLGMMVMAESFDAWVVCKNKNDYSTKFGKIDDTPYYDHMDRQVKAEDAWWKRDLTQLVLVNRNHPSIIMWSIGNEIFDQRTKEGIFYTHAMQDLVHKLDPSRLCTQGMNWPGDAIHWGIWQAMGIPGINYHTTDYKMARQMSPNGFILSTESASTLSSRGIYKFPVKDVINPSMDVEGGSLDDGQVSSYDLVTCIWSDLPDDNWIYQDHCPWVIGEFVWTGFDYLGEPTPYDDYWPSRSSYFGIYDLAGLPKDRAFLYRSHWAPEKETLHLLPHWNWPGREGKETPVFCYTSYPEAELFVNGKSYGRKHKLDVSLEDYEKERINVTTPWGDVAKFPNPNAPEGKNRVDRYRLRWMDVKYEPGEVKVIAYDKNGNKAAERILRTAGKPHHLELTADKKILTATPTDTDGNRLDTPDLAFVTVKVVDKDGNTCPTANNQLSFAVSSAQAAENGSYVARYNSSCNGDATSIEPFVQPTMKAFNGEVVVIVEAGTLTGNATLTVSGKGIKKASLDLEVK